MLAAKIPSWLIYGYIDNRSDKIVIVELQARNESLSTYVEYRMSIVELEEVFQ